MVITHEINILCSIKMYTALWISLSLLHSLLDLALRPDDDNGDG